MSCPWPREAAPYDFPMCEQPLCAWITQPANTWSNLGMLGVGAFLMARGMKSRSESDVFIGLAVFIMGVCSFLAHATAMPLFAFLDVTAIFLLLSILSTLSFVRGRTMARVDLAFAGVFAAAVVLQLVSGRNQILALVFFGVFLVATEIRFLRLRRPMMIVSPLMWGLGLQTVAAGALALDYTRSACSPDNHYFQFHAVWHLLSGVALFFIANYMRQFNLRIFARG